MYFGLERKVPESADADVGQAQRRVIHADVAAAFRAITTIADVAALEFAEKLRAFDKAYIILLPQCERAHRRSGIAPAIFTMTVTHLQRFAAHLDLHCSAITAAFMCLRHGRDLIRKKGNEESRNIGIEEGRS